MKKNIVLNHLYSDLKIKIKVKDIINFFDNIVEYRSKKDEKEWEVKETQEEIYFKIFGRKIHDVDLSILKIKSMISKVNDENATIKFKTHRKDKRELRCISYNSSKIKDCFVGWGNDNENYETQKKIFYYQLSRKYKTMVKKSFKEYNKKAY